MTASRRELGVAGVELLEHVFKPVLAGGQAHGAHGSQTQSLVVAVVGLQQECFDPGKGAGGEGLEGAGADGGRAGRIGSSAPESINDSLSLTLGEAAQLQAQDELPEDVGGYGGHVLIVVIAKDGRQEAGGGAVGGLAQGLHGGRTHLGEGVVDGHGGEARELDIHARIGEPHGLDDDLHAGFVGDAGPAGFERLHPFAIEVGEDGKLRGEKVGAGGEPFEGLGELGQRCRGDAHTCDGTQRLALGAKVAGKKRLHRLRHGGLAGNDGVDLLGDGQVEAVASGQG